MRNPDEWGVLAGRKNSRWASFDPSARKNIKAKLVGHDYTERYLAVNLNNRHTLEVRMFRGSLKVERVKMGLEFVDAAVEYTRQLTTEDIVSKAGLSASEFIKWIDPEIYPNLSNYVQELGIVQDAEEVEE
jgi:hypothetical protein